MLYPAELRALVNFFGSGGYFASATAVCKRGRWPVNFAVQMMRMDVKSFLLAKQIKGWKLARLSDFSCQT